MINKSMPIEVAIAKLVTGVHPLSVFVSDLPNSLYVIFNYFDDFTSNEYPEISIHVFHPTSAYIPTT